MADCPVIDHLACKIPGTLEPRVYDVWKFTELAANAFLPSQQLDIANRDAAWHLASIGFHSSTGPANIRIRLYNSRGSGLSDSTVRIGMFGGGPNAAIPVNPSYVWPVNSSLIYDLENPTGTPASFHLFFFGFKIFDRGKQPC
jgi:hypothetical protein